MQPIQLKIITSSGIVFDDKVESFLTTTIVGDITLNLDYVNTVAPLKNCISTIKLPNGNKKELIIINGLLYNERKQIRIFTKTFTFIESNTINEVQKSLNELKTMISKMETSTAEYIKTKYFLDIEEIKLELLKNKK